jgi:hypothetical protein
LRTKEFLGKHKIPFLSRNVLTDEEALNELLALGTRQLPVVSKNGEWVNGQSLKDTARIAGINLGAVQHLPPEELVRRLDLVLEGAARFFAQFPQDHLEDQLPGRPRSLAQLTYHLFNVADALLEHEVGIPLTADSYKRYPNPGEMTREEILAYGADVRSRVAEWWADKSRHTSLTAKANVYYGDVTFHEFIERTTWHSGQHARQLMWAVSDRFGLAVDMPLGPEMWVGLPMPEQVWDG